MNTQSNKQAKSPTIDRAVKISPEVYFSLKEYSIINGIKIKWLLNEAVSSYLKSHKKAKK